jgi:hypothetical protein
MHNVDRPHSSIAPYSRPKLLDSTPTLEIYVHSTAPSSHNHSSLFLGLPNISLEVWISQTEVTVLYCISNANDDHVQTNTIDDNFLRRRDG